MTETTQGVDAHTLMWAIRKLATAFPASFSDDQAVEDRAVLWREMLDANPWITKGIFTTGVYAIAWKHSGNFIPEPATALGYFDGARTKVARETAKALPKPSGDDPQHWFRNASAEEVWAVFAPNYLRGKAKQRIRNRLMIAYREQYGIPKTHPVPEEAWRGQDEPTEANLAALEREMETKAWWQKRSLPPEVRDLPRGKA